MNNVEKNELRKALGHFATGVTVITSLHSDGTLAGFTANAFTSLSLEPPLVVICVDLGARSYPAIKKYRQFCIHVLAEDQEHIAKKFAEKHSEKSGICAWHLTNDGYPVLDHYHALVQCTVELEYPGGDHAIVVGKVSRVDVATQASGPLLYYKGAMQGVLPPKSENHDFLASPATASG